jgi:propionyl-CoA carboxylase beta chain
VTKDQLGGAMTHNSTSGVAHFMSHNDEECLLLLRELLSFLLRTIWKIHPARIRTIRGTRVEPALDTMVPPESNIPYDIKDIIHALSTTTTSSRSGALREESRDRLRRLDGRPSESSRISRISCRLPRYCGSIKGARFVRFCDAFNIPLVTFEDVPGFLPGTNQEFGGIIKHGAKLLFAFAEATVPKITVITRKAYGGAYCVMSSKHIRTDVNFAYPTAEIAVMGPEGAVNIIYRRELANAKNVEQQRQEKVEEFHRKVRQPYIAAEHGFIDEIIQPRFTRPKLITPCACWTASAIQTRPKNTGISHFRKQAIVSDVSEDVLERLTKHRTLSEAPPAQIEWVANHGYIRKFATGEILTAKQQPVTGLHIVLSGHFVIYVRARVWKEKSDGMARRRYHRNDAVLPLWCRRPETSSRKNLAKSSLSSASTCLR